MKQVVHYMLFFFFKFFFCRKFLCLFIFLQFKIDKYISIFKTYKTFHIAKIINLTDKDYCLRMMAHTCNSSNWEAGARGSLQTRFALIT